MKRAPWQVLCILRTVLEVLEISRVAENPLRLAKRCQGLPIMSVSAFLPLLCRFYFKQVLQIPEGCLEPISLSSHCNRKERPSLPQHPVSNLWVASLGSRASPEAWDSGMLWLLVEVGNYMYSLSGSFYEWVTWSNTSLFFILVLACLIFRMKYSQVFIKYFLSIITVNSQLFHSYLLGVFELKVLLVWKSRIW